MIYGNLIIIRTYRDKAISAVSNVQPLSVIVIDAETGEMTYPEHSFLDSTELNQELDMASSYLQRMRSSEATP